MTLLVKSNREQISVFELGLQTLRILGMHDRLAIPISVLDSYAGNLERPFLAARSANVALDSSRAYELGYDPPPLRSQLEELLPAAWRMQANDEDIVDVETEPVEPNESK